MPERLAESDLRLLAALAEDADLLGIFLQFVEGVQRRLLLL
jgi:hypothetical protein